MCNFKLTLIVSMANGSIPVSFKNPQPAQIIIFHKSQGVECQKWANDIH